MVVKGWVDDDIDINTGHNHLYDMTVTPKDLQTELNELGNEAFETAEFLGEEKDPERISTVVRSMWEYLSLVMYMCFRYSTRGNITINCEQDKGYKAYRKAMTAKEGSVKELVSELRECSGDLLEAAANMANETDEQEIYTIANCAMDCLCWLVYLCGAYCEKYRIEHND